jgi:hypothetical protein
VDVYIHVFLTSASFWGEWWASSTSRFTPEKRAPVPIRWEAGRISEPVWMIWRSDNCWTHRDSNSDPSVVQPVAIRYTDCATAALIRSIRISNASSWWKITSSDVTKEYSHLHVIWYSHGRPAPGVWRHSMSQHFFPKHRHLYAKLYGVTSRKTIIIMSGFLSYTFDILLKCKHSEGDKSLSVCKV